MRHIPVLLTFAVLSASPFAASAKTVKRRDYNPKETIPVAGPKTPVGPIERTNTAPKNKQEPLFTLKNSSVIVRAREQYNNDGKQTVEKFQYNVDLKLQLRLDRDGQWRVISHARSGPTYGAPWQDLGIGKDSKFSDELNVRTLYLQRAGDHGSEQIGFLPVLPDPGVKGVFNFDEDGWIDGARLQRTSLGQWATKVTVTVGRIADINTPAAFSRGIHAPNVIQIHVQGNLSKRIAYAVEATQFNPQGAESEQWVRVITEIATKDVVKFVDKIILEPLIRNSDKPLQGFALSAQTALSDTWSLSSVYSIKGKETARSERLYAPREDFYGEGHQISFFLTKKLKDHPIEYGIAGFKTLSGPQTGREQRAIDLVSRKGTRIEGRIKFKF
jgi:hypothetical protein